MVVLTKKCTGPCGRDLEVSARNFHRQKDRFAKKCIECIAAYQREYRSRTRAPDMILDRSPFKKGDIVEFRGRRVKVSHGMPMPHSEPRIVVFAATGPMRRGTTVAYKALVAEAKKVEAT